MIRTLEESVNIRAIAILNPRHLVFGNDCLYQFLEDYRSQGYRKLLRISAPPILPSVELISTIG